MEYIIEMRQKINKRLESSATNRSQCMLDRTIVRAISKDFSIGFSSRINIVAENRQPVDCGTLSNKRQRQNVKVPGVSYSFFNDGNFFLDSCRGDREPKYSHVFFDEQ